MGMRHIMLVEENEELKKLLQSYLVSAGYRVFAASDEKQVLKYLTTGNKRNELDLVICDLNSHPVGNIQTINFLSAHLPSISIIALWKSPDFNLMKVLSDLGVKKFLSLPVDKNLLLKSVEDEINLSSKHARSA